MKYIYIRVALYYRYTGVLQYLCVPVRYCGIYEYKSGHDIGHWPAGPTAIFSCLVSSGHKQAFWTAPNGPVATVRVTSVSGEHWPDANKRQFIVGFCHNRVAVPLPLFGFAFDDATLCPVN